MNAIIEHIAKVCNREDCAFRPIPGEPVYCFGCVHYTRKADFSLLISTEDQMETERLRFLGIKGIKEHYCGDNVDCRAGDIVVVSRAKKAQLFRDMPGEWEDVGKKKEIEETPAPEPVVSMADYLADLPNKKAVIEAAEGMGLDIDSRMNRGDIEAMIMEACDE